MAETTDDIFDAEKSEALKREGMALGASPRLDVLSYARSIAKEIALRRASRTVTADDVGRELKARGIESLGPAGGSLFKTPEWQWTGDYVKSHRITNHSRMLRVWRYRPGGHN